MAHVTKGIGNVLKKIRDKMTYEVPTGPHTDVRKRKLKPSYLKKITGVGPPPKTKVFTVTETKRGKPHWTSEGQDASIKRKFQRKSDAYHKKLESKK